MPSLDENAPGGVFLVGSGVDVASIKPALESATSLNVSASEEPETALARGAALASANAPLFASSTAALAYAQDSGTGVVDAYAVPDYLDVLGGPMGTHGAEFGDDDLLAYSAVSDDDADAPTVLIDRRQSVGPHESHQPRRTGLLIGSGLAVVGISAVVALEIALAIGIRTTVALQPSPNQSLIVPAQPVLAPPVVEASAGEAQDQFAGADGVKAAEPDACGSGARGCAARRSGSAPSRRGPPGVAGSGAGDPHADSRTVVKPTNGSGSDAPFAAPTGNGPAAGPRAAAAVPPDSAE